MSRGPSDCEMLGPALVAHVHGDSHPEEEILRAHLASCSACRDELRELEETLEWVGHAGPLATEGARRGGGALLGKALPAAAAVLLAGILFLQQPSPTGPLASRQMAWPALTRDAPGPPSFLGEELDMRLEGLDDRLALLSESVEAGW